MFTCYVFFLSLAGGVIVEQDENDRLVMKPYNVNEANKLRAKEQEEAPV